MQFNNTALTELKYKEVVKNFILSSIQPPCFATFKRWQSGVSEPNMTQINILKRILNVEYDVFIKK